MKPEPPVISSRIASLDGLRAIAVLGVIWAHVWAFSGTPVLSLGRLAGVELDLNRAFSIVGTGVDLFFVISGFCMYLMYADKQSHFSWNGYWLFLKKRWRRIAPAFYVTAGICALGFVFVSGKLPIREIVAHIVFLHTVIPGTGALAAPLWSIATEWQFYVVLPFMIVLGARMGFWPLLGSAIALSLAFRVWMFASPYDIQLAWKDHLPARLVEFMFGVGVARMYAGNALPPRILRGARGFVVGAAVAYLGRLLMVTEVVGWAGEVGRFLRAFAEPVLTLGYGVIVWNVVMTPSCFGRVLETPAAQAIGRWSYSLYLWHWWPAYWISRAMTDHYGATVSVQHLAFVAALLVLIPVSAVSYRYLEMPYFVRRSKTSVMPVAESGV